MIRTLLVANRGEIARRIFRTCRSLGIATVAVHSEPDAAAPFVAEADTAVALGGTTPAESYLRTATVVEAALAAGADAVHPGYGFLSENASFAAAVIDAGLTWVGPPPAAIEAMGSKLGARRIMGTAGVPVLPGADLTGVDDASLHALADEVGWPVLVKASAGGGGRGMRVVRHPEDLAGALVSARREATAAFGDGTVFLERYVDRPRHIEIQIFGDAHGDVVALFERECSVQRRHQKIIEEAPSPAVGPDLRTAMSAAAVTAGRAIDYRGAGTVEFVVTPEGEYFFLEVNTRLQVEHPVTEAVTGLDLVALQLAVAEGRPLPDEVHTATIHGHAIEARVYAEDPLAAYLPVAGTLTRFEIPGDEPGAGPGGGVPGGPAGAGIRVDSGYVSGDTVSVHYDPMLAKVVAWGATRDEARRRLIGALRAARIHGVTTNRDLLVAVLDHDEFASGRIDTHFLDRHPPAALTPPPDPASPTLRRAAIAAALAEQAAARCSARAWADAPSGWRNNPSQPQVRRYRTGDAVVEVHYRLTRNGWYVEVDGQPAGIAISRADAHTVELIDEGVRRRLRVEVAGERVWVDGPDGSVGWHRVPRFPEPGAVAATGSLTAPMPGLVRLVRVAAGDTVKEGEALVVMEAMKMEHTVVAPAAGRVSAVPVAEGQTIDAGTTLVVLEATDVLADGHG